MGIFFCDQRSNINSIDFCVCSSPINVSHLNWAKPNGFCFADSLFSHTLPCINEIEIENMTQFAQWILFGCYSSVLGIRFNCKIKLKSQTMQRGCPTSSLQRAACSIVIFFECVQLTSYIEVCVVLVFLLVVL